MARLVPALAFLTILAFSGFAAADDPPARARSAAEPRVVRLGEIVVPGWIHNPGVIFVLERSRPRFSPTPLQRSFLPELVRSARGL